MIRFVLMDIEGTTTSIDFVHKVLFPYASQYLRQYVKNHIEEDRIQKNLLEVKETVKQESGRLIADHEAIDQLLSWIIDDRKHSALKELQGFMWKEGYESGQYKAHLYEDVLPQIRSWYDKGLELGVYSSGSIAAQKLLFKYSEKGDLTPYLGAYFDTTIGYKREVSAYENIQKKLGIPSAHILFLSDVEAELDAAQSAGFQTVQLVRPGTLPSSKHKTAHGFDEISI
ncbi:MAG: enolase-phosphatase E1 [Saprospiraceae bacterium]|jgi:enolase-phosphatase E1